MMNEKTELECARQTISEIDREMSELFVRRMRAAEAVAAYKREHGLPVLDPSREEAVIARGASLVEDDVLRDHYVSFIKDVMKISRSYQEQLLSGMRVAYAGVPGAFAYIAAARLFQTAEKRSYPDFSSAYRAVETGECDAAVLPMENSTNGEVGQVTDLFFRGSLYVNGILDLPVTQDLLARPGAALGDIRRVYSHPQALAQCADFLRRHGIEGVEYLNTAAAAKMVAEQKDLSVGAIGSREAAELFGLSVLESSVNESRSNTTRFAVLSRSRRPMKSEQGAHFILVFTARNRPGSLSFALDIIGRHGFNMRTLRSRPMKELLWQYYFYVEAEGNIDTPEGRMMLEDLSAACEQLKVVGSYTE